MSSKDLASSSRNPQPLESNENRFDSVSNNPTHVQFHHRRSPLNAIPDPSQLRRDVESDSDAPKLDGADGSQTLDEKTSVSSSEGLVPVGKYVSVWGLGTSTPKATSSRARVNTESNSAQSTPTRSSGIRGLGTGSRVYQSNGGRTFSRISRRFTIVNTEHAETVVDAPHFELEEDPLFWKDHNVQVLIRVRPLNNMERVLQGNARCLKQENAHTLIWLGHPETRFTFDHVVCETITQEKLFRVAGLPMVKNCMSGYNSCIFAYGQTGSGKTYTMMGEIHENEGNLDQDCGITPRIFEYLFTRIKAEEESRRDEKLTYNCKCSFLEIYNEQITDLLEPSSTNLQLREDFKKGVYVENLTEHNVRTVNDVLQLLLKGAANRKIAATHMNSESSRSHSVFTCIIESRWEKDSMIHSRYGRLNLVDLAGSERQKSSGAEGDRLKEAANINKSLSTLGLVIMSLVDVAHGKQRHVPYRDSRLTFLLQDSLGGNSKTTIIANVSPSFCSATETLSTLKFAQRAKLIQNNAKVNEDASGDVTALQEQVQRLKEQLSHLLNNQRHPIEQFLSHGSTQLSLEDFPGKFDPSVDVNVVYKQELRNANEKIKCLESALACSFKREKMAHTAVKKLEAELESRSTLVQHLEDEAHHRTAKLLLKEVIDSSLKDLEMKEADTISLGDTVSTRSDFGCDTTSNLAEDEIQLENSDYQMDGMTSLKSTVVAKELSDARLLIEALECEHIRLTQELQLTEERNQQLLDILGREHMQKNLLISSHYTPKEMQIPNNKNQTLMKLANEDFRSLALQAKLEKMSKELQEARTWNKQYQEDEALKLHHQKDVELIREQVEVETASTIIHLQEEIAMLQTELNERLSNLTAENNQLRNVIADKDDQLNDMSTQWEKATIELTSFLMDGSKSLNNASSRIRSMACLFPRANGSLGENIESAARACMEKEEMILLLQKSLEDAQKTVFEMEQKLNSLKGVAIAFTEAQHLVSTGCSEELYDESITNIKSMNYELDPLWNVADEVCEDPEASLSELKRLSHSSSLEHDFGKAPQMAGNSEHVSRLISDTEAQAHESAIGESEVLNDSIRLRLQEFEGEALASYEDTEKHLLDFQKDILESSAVSKESVESLGKDTGASLGNIEHLKGKCNCLQFAYSEMPICEPSKGPNTNDHEMISCIREGLAETNNRLGLIQASVDKLLEAYADKWESDSSTSDSSLSLTSTSAGEKGPSYGSDSKCLHEVDGSMLIEELELASRAFRNLCVSLTSLVTQTDLTIKPHGDSNQSLGFVVNNNLCGHVSVNKKRRLSEVSCLPQSPNAGTEGAYLDSSCSKIFAPDGKMEQSSNFFSNFEEAYATMKEADLMLNKLVKSNENAKELAHMWKQVGKELKGERDCLLDQVQQLKSKLCSSKSEDGTLENEKSNLIEVTKSVSSLVDFFEDMRKDLEELLSGVYSDLLSMSKDVQSYVGSRRDLFEQICAEFIEKEFSSLVVCVCIGDYLSSMQGLCVQREQISLLNEANSAAVNCGTLSREEGEKIVALPILEIEESFPLLGNLSQENLQLKRELERKEVVLKGLLFDFTLLQEAASNRKDIRDEINKLIVALGQAEFELQVKRHDVNSLLLQVREMEESLTDTKHALAISNSELEQTQRSLDTSSNDNHELRLLVNDLHRKKSEAEKQLDEQDEVIKGLEKEILHLTSLASERVFQSIENVEDDLLRVTAERNELREEIKSLTEKMEMACALAEENEAVALEAQQDSVASKIYAEQKEEEVKILESSIEELEDTVNVLEKKVQEMDEEVQKHRLDRNSLETEIQALRQRMLTVENLTENMDQEDSIHEKLENHVPRRFENQVLDLDQAYAQIKVLKRIRAEQAKEIDRMKEYVSELVLHAEAQASQYQHKYKTLEAMACELKKKSSSMVSVAPVLEKPERSSSRPRRSSSPFRCISNLVHQMNVEKDHELSTAKARIEDLEVLAASRQKEVCMLSSRLAAAESMTHDVIRDLLGLKLDMTSYANLVDEHQLHRLLDVAQQKIAESKRKEEEIHKLKTQIHDLIDERDRCITEINRRESNVLAARLTVKLLKERDQYLTVQNEMLKVEKTNLMHRLVQTGSTADANASLEGRRIRARGDGPPVQIRGRR